jgi:2-keto-3-deoxy-L-rhamnonate aldolase RhmA
MISSLTISSFNPDLYCEARKHVDFIWFEMQHSTMSWDDIRRMIIACPGVDGGAPFIRMPDALEANMQKATDLGAVGIIVPTVDDALEARDAARFARYPPTGRRSSGGGSFGTAWPGINYRATINDNMLVTVMIETLEGVANAEEIAATAGIDVIILGNNDLSSFSGWAQNDPRYQDAVIKVHNAALKYGKFFGNAGQQYRTGYTVSADTRMIQDGPARDGWTPPRGGGAARGAAPAAGAGRGAAPQPEEAEPVIGLPAAPAAPRGRGNQ